MSQWWRESIPVPRRAVWTVLFCALGGMGLIVSQGHAVPWPNPWRDGDDERPLLKQGLLEQEEEQAVEAVDRVDEMLAALDEEGLVQGTTLAEIPAEDAAAAPVCGESGDGGTQTCAPATSAPAVANAGPAVQAARSMPATGPSAPRPAAAAAAVAPSAPAPQVPAVALSAEEAGVQPVENPCISGTEAACKARALDSFYAALAQAKNGRKVRILVYGDSLIMGDLIVSSLREQIQKVFGNGGPGWVVPVKTCPWYRRTGMSFVESSGWSFVRVTKPQTDDGLYGLGGQAFVAKEGGKTGKVGCAKECPWSGLAEYEVYYLAHPRGGKFKMTLEDGSSQVVDTKADKAGSGFAKVAGKAGNLGFTLEAISGTLRLFGVVAESAGGGVVVDNLAVLGARSYRFNNMDAAHFADQLKRRKPDLIILLFGANESEIQFVAKKEYTADLEQLIGTLKKGAPGASILMASPPAAGERVDGKIQLRRSIPDLIKVQRDVCQRLGVAFWDEFQAMGGEKGTSGWLKKGLLTGDLVHLSGKGGAVLGKFLYAALMQEYLKFRKLAGR